MSDVFNFVLSDFERKIQRILEESGFKVDVYNSLVEGTLKYFILKWNNGLQTAIKPFSRGGGVDILVATIFCRIPAEKVDEIKQFTNLYNDNSKYDWLALNLFQQQNNTYALTLKTTLMCGDSFDEKNMKSQFIYLVEEHAKKVNNLPSAINPIICQNSSAAEEFEQYKEWYM